MVSSTFRNEAWSPDGDQALILLTIDHDDLADPIRVVNNNENVDSNGETFVAFPFKIALPDSLVDAAPRARLIIDNVTREIGQTIRLISTPPSVTIQIVRQSDPDTVEMEFPAMKLQNVRYDALTVEGELSFVEMAIEPFPAYVFNPGTFRSLL